MTIYIDVYFDEFDIKTGPSSGNLTKIGGVYYTIANLNYESQCKRSDIMVNALITKENFDKVKIVGLFEPFVNAINELNEEKTIRLGKFDSANLKP